MGFVLFAFLKGPGALCGPVWDKLDVCFGDCNFAQDSVRSLLETAGAQLRVPGRSLFTSLTGDGGEGAAVSLSWACLGSLPCSPACGIEASEVTTHVTAL